MAILKVITDEKLPKTCGACRYIEVRPKGRKVFWECYFVDRHIESRDMPRPDWCPLKERCEICEGVGFVLHATQGTMPCPECNQESEDW